MRIINIAVAIVGISIVLACNVSEPETDLVPTETTDLVDQSPLILKGKVLDAITESPIVGVCVTLGQELDDYILAEQIVNTDSTGTYELDIDSVDIAPLSLITRHSSYVRIVKPILEAISDTINNEYIADFHLYDIDYAEEYLPWVSVSLTGWMLISFPQSFTSPGMWYGIDSGGFSAQRTDSKIKFYSEYGPGTGWSPTLKDTLELPIEDDRYLHYIINEQDTLGGCYFSGISDNAFGDRQGALYVQTRPGDQYIFVCNIFYDNEFHEHVLLILETIRRD